MPRGVYNVILHAMGDPNDESQGGGTGGGGTGGSGGGETGGGGTGGGGSDGGSGSGSGSGWVTVGQGPQIESMSPSSASRGDEVVITGSGFTDGAGATGVTVGDEDADVTYWSDSEIRMTVPAEANSGSQETIVTAADLDSEPATLAVKGFAIGEIVPPVGSILVKVRTGISAVSVAIAHGDTVSEPLFPDESDPVLSRWHEVRVPAGTEIQKVNEYSNDPDVEWVETDSLVEPLAAPNDDYYAGKRQWSLEQDSDADIDASHAWDVSKGAGSEIAIVDNDIRPHQDLNVNLSSIRSETDGCPNRFLSHGTHVAGIASADTNNSYGIAGVGWNAKLFGYETGYVYDPPGPKVEKCYLRTKAIARSINHASKAGRDVINMSFGSYTDHESWKDVLRTAWRRGVVLVAAAGNDGEKPKGTKRMYPAGFSHVPILSVGALGKNGVKTDYSQKSRGVDVNAPGGTQANPIWSPAYFEGQGGIWGDYGTSMAAPHVTGIAALLKAEMPSAANGMIVAAIQSSVEGEYRRVNAATALRKLVDIKLPNGTFVRQDDTSRVHFIHDGFRHRVFSRVLNSWGISSAEHPSVAVVQRTFINERDAGHPLGFRPGTILSPQDSDTYFFVSNDPPTAGQSWVRGFKYPISVPTLSCLGYDTTRAIEVGTSLLKLNPTAATEWADCTRHPNGTVIQDGDRPSILHFDGRRPIETDSILNSWGFVLQDVIVPTADDLLAPIRDPLGLRPGSIVRFGDASAVFFITSSGNDFAQGSRRQFEYPLNRTCYGFSGLTPTSVEDSIARLHSTGSQLRC